MQLKKNISKSPQLHFLIQFDVTFQTDASEDRIGCCLLQKKQPVAYASSALTENEKRFPQIEKKLLAFSYSLEKFHYYVYGTTVTIESDHRPLTTITKKDIMKTTSRLQRLLLKLLKYDITFVYVSGSQLLTS